MVVLDTRLFGFEYAVIRMSTWAPFTWFELCNAQTDIETNSPLALRKTMGRETTDQFGGRVYVGDRGRSCFDCRRDGSVPGSELSVHLISIHLGADRLLSRHSESVSEGVASGLQQMSRFSHLGEFQEKRKVDRLTRSGPVQSAGPTDSSAAGHFGSQCFVGRSGNRC